jgi:hypothetical protein
VPGLFDYAEPSGHSRVTRLADVAFPLTEKGRHSDLGFRSSIIPPASPLSTLRYAPSRNHRQDSRPEWSRFSFSVGLFHPLQCAGLSRRSVPHVRPSVHGPKTMFSNAFAPSHNCSLWNSCLRARQKRSKGLRPVFFVPRTLRRTWGTRPELRRTA